MKSFDRATETKSRDNEEIEEIQEDRTTMKNANEQRLRVCVRMDGRGLYERVKAKQTKR